MPRIDEIITSTSAAQMLDRVSPIYENSYVGLWMFEAIGREYDKLWYVADTLPAQLFPETVTWAIELWEQRYGITPTSEQSIEERRQKILAMRTLPRPFNPYSVESFIRAMYGRASEVADNVAPYTFGVYIIANDSPRELITQDIRSYFDKHKPSHMTYELGFEAKTEIKIGVQTGFYRFDYDRAGTAEAGTLPDTNIIAGL